MLSVNRMAGRRSSDPSTIRDLAIELGVDCRVEAPGTVEEMSESLEQAAHSGINHFAVAGGDGTLNLAANKLLSLGLDHAPVVAVIPTGTGCDLLRTFGLSQDLRDAVGRLATDDIYKIDVVSTEGSWGTRFFVNVAQAGVGAAAAETAPRIPRRLGSARYPIAFAARLARFPRARVRITTEKRSIESDALAVILANGQFFAGGWNVAPRATLVDGVLDVQIISAAKTRAPALVPKLIKGTHLSDPDVRRFTAAEFTLEADPGWPVEADGDLIGNTTISGRVVPAAINLKI